MSGLEIITITFSIILGLGVTQILGTVAHVIRERSDHQLHWIPLSLAALILLFQVQFWFALVIVDSFLEQWNWTVYSILLFLAIVIFLAGATVLPSSGSSRSSNLIEDFDARGKISLMFFALYFIGWIVVAIMFWTDQFITLVIANSIMATASMIAYYSRSPHIRSVLHGVLISLTLYGLIYVWATPSLEW